MSKEIHCITGERREATDKLLDHAASLLGDGKCGFRSCYGQGEELLNLKIWGSKGERDVDFVVCEDHIFFVELVTQDAPDEASLAGFFITHLDERIGLKQAHSALVSDPEMN